MTTIVNSPTPTNESGGFGFLVGVVVLVAFVLILIFYGIPVLQNMGPVQLKVPAPQIVMPEKIDVNVNQSK